MDSDIMIHVYLLQELFHCKTFTHLQTITLLTLKSTVLDWSPTSVTAFKTWVKHTHACHLALLLLAVTVSLLVSFPPFRCCYINMLIFFKTFFSWNSVQFILH